MRRALLLLTLLLGAWMPWQGVVDLPCCQSFAYSTWDPTRNSANSTYSSGNTVWTCSDCEGIASNALGTFNHSQGQWHAEFTVGTVDGCCDEIGFGNGSLGTGDFLGDNTNNGIGYQNNGDVYIANAIVATLATYASGAIICMDIDLSNKLLYIWPSTGMRPGTGINIAATSSLVLYPGASGGFTASQSVTLNTGATSFACTSAYTPWH